ncbi:MAG: hypothetical protein ACP5N1_00290 [Candidatus Woesearchaeota archaeon]
MKIKAQIAIEFLLLLAVAIGVIMVLLVSFLYVSQTNLKIKTFQELEDLGQSLQQEFFLAAELEDGYNRKINIPMTLSDTTQAAYQLKIVQANKSLTNYSFLVIDYSGQEIYYAIPPVSGQIYLGNNLLIKDNHTLKING